MRSPNVFRSTETRRRTEILSNREPGPCLASFPLTDRHTKIGRCASDKLTRTPTLHPHRNLPKDDQSIRLTVHRIIRDGSYSPTRSTQYRTPTRKTTRFLELHARLSRQWGERRRTAMRLWENIDEFFSRDVSRPSFGHHRLEKEPTASGVLSHVLPATR